MDWVRQAPGLCHARTKKLSDSHSFIKTKCNLQWSWQLSSQVTNQPVMVGQAEWILPCSLSKAGWKRRLNEWWSLVCVVRGRASVAWGTPADGTFKKTRAKRREHPKMFAAPFMHPMCSWMGTVENTIAECGTSVSLTPQKRGVDKATPGVAHRSRPEFIFYTFFSF